MSGSFSYIADPGGIFVADPSGVYVETPPSISYNGGIIWPVRLDPAVVPTVEFEIDWTHPLAAGLLSLYIPGLQIPGPPFQILDFAFGPPLQGPIPLRLQTQGPLGTATSGWVQTTRGAGQIWGAAQPASGMTIAWLGQFQAAPTYVSGLTGTAFGLFGVQGFGAPGTNGVLDWYGDPTGFWYLNTNSGGSNIYVRGPGLPSGATGPVMYAASISFSDSGGSLIEDPTGVLVEDPTGIFIQDPGTASWTADVYASGMQVATATGAYFGGLDFYASGVTIHLGGLSSNPATTNPSSLSYMMGIWGNPLSPGLLQWLAAEPFAMLKPRRRSLPTRAAINSGSIFATYPIAPADLTTSIARASREPADAQGGIALASNLPVEANAGIAERSSDWMDWRGPVVGHSQEPAESAGAFSSGMAAGMPMEVEAGVTTSNPDLFDTTESVVGTPAAPLDTNMTVAATHAGLPAESQTGEGPSKPLLAETLASPKAVETALIDSTGITFTASSVLAIPLESISREVRISRNPAETTAGVRGKQGVPAESKTSETRLTGAPMETLSQTRVVAPDALPMEALGHPRFTTLAPVESLQGQRVGTARMPMETLSGVRLQAALPADTIKSLYSVLGLSHLPIETKAALAMRTQALADTARSMRAWSEVLPVEAIRAVQAVDRLAEEVLLGMRLVEHVPVEATQTQFVEVAQAGIPLDTVWTPLAATMDAFMEEIGAASYLPPSGRIYLVAVSTDVADGISLVAQSFEQD